MRSSEDKDGWSDLKKWIMGIVAAIIMIVINDIYPGPDKGCSQDLSWEDFKECEKGNK